MYETMKKLPIGVECFEEMRRENFYYVDKTGMIKELTVAALSKTLCSKSDTFDR